MKYISPLLASASGTLGGAVASKARGGVNYFRARVIPTNPSTLLQTAIRMAVQSASALWTSALTELQQQGWFDIATGAQTGKSLFAKVNQPRIYATNSGRVTTKAGVAATLAPDYFPDAPTSGMSTPFALSTLPTIDDSDNTLILGTIPAGDWQAGADADNNPIVFIYVSGPQTASRFSRQRPYQLIRAIKIVDELATAVTAISLAAFGLPTVADRVFYVKIYAQDATGRTSLPLEYRVTVTA